LIDFGSVLKCTDGFIAETKDNNNKENSRILSKIRINGTKFSKIINWRSLILTVDRCPLYYIKLIS